MRMRSPKSRMRHWPIPALFLVGLVVFTVGVEQNWGASASTRFVPPLVALLAIGGWMALSRTRAWWWPGLLRRLEQHTDAIDALPQRRIGLWIALAAGLGLYLELMVIR